MKLAIAGFYSKMINQFDKTVYYRLCDELGAKDVDLKNILTTYGYPPFWVRPNTFETLVLTILEQQVSLASAYAAYKKLKEKLKRLTPKNVLSLTDEELRQCYFSRQKIVYVRELANAIVTKQISLKGFTFQTDDKVREELKTIKGIGMWTVDIYLIHALQRTDIFPLGDLALVNAMRMIKQVPFATKEELLQIAESWKPYRSIATMMLWHYYIKKRNIRLLH
ncbi:MAG: DNA-3-methyladenine glycosylase [Chitinophagaceae bacterium]